MNVVFDVNTLDNAKTAGSLLNVVFDVNTLDNA